MLSPADPYVIRAEPAAIDLGARLNDLQPLQIERSYQNSFINGRSRELSQIEFALPKLEMHRDREDLGSALDNAADIELIGESKVEKATEHDDKAIWLAIHQPEFEVTWLEETFTISHYTYALERDPIYADDELVSVPGLPEADLYKSGFIYGGRGILLQGTGLAENGRFITIDWERSYHDPNDFTNNRWFFKYGQGGTVKPWKTAATHHPDLPQGTRIIIESYLGEHTFVVADSGLDLAENQIDIFIGDLTIEEADQFGVKWSKVAIIEPIDYTASADLGEINRDAEGVKLAD